MTNVLTPGPLYRVRIECDPMGAKAGEPTIDGSVIDTGFYMDEGDGCGMQWPLSDLTRIVIDFDGGAA